MWLMGEQMPLDSGARGSAMSVSLSRHIVAGIAPGTAEDGAGVVGI